MSGVRVNPARAPPSTPTTTTSGISSSDQITYILLGGFLFAAIAAIVQFVLHNRENDDNNHNEKRTYFTNEELQDLRKKREIETEREIISEMDKLEQKLRASRMRRAGIEGKVETERLLREKLEEWDYQGRAVYGDAWEESLDGNLPLKELFSFPEEEIWEIKKIACELMNQKEMLAFERERNARETARQQDMEEGVLNTTAQKTFIEPKEAFNALEIACQQDQEEGVLNTTTPSTFVEPKETYRKREKKHSRRRRRKHSTSKQPTKTVNDDQSSSTPRMINFSPAPSLHLENVDMQREFVPPPSSPNPYQLNNCQNANKVRQELQVQRRQSSIKEFGSPSFQQSTPDQLFVPLEQTLKRPPKESQPLLTEQQQRKTESSPSSTSPSTKNNEISTLDCKATDYREPLTTQQIKLLDSLKKVLKSRKGCAIGIE